MDRHEEVKTFRYNKMDKNWQESVNIGAKYVKICQEFLNALDELQEMWEERLGCIEMAKSHINLNAPADVLLPTPWSVLDQKYVNSRRPKHQNAPHQGYRDCPVRKGITDLNCPKKDGFLR